MKHIIPDPDSYFDELDNYEFMIEVTVSQTNWLMTSPAYNTSNNRRTFHAANPTCSIILDEKFKDFQKLIDNKSILVAGHHALSDKLYPINHISSKKGVNLDASVILRIFYNSDTISFITKFKLKL